MAINRKKRKAGSADPNLTPLLDIVLQLITFFMMLVHFGSQSEHLSGKVRLPVAPAALPAADLTFDRLAVELDAQGMLLTGDQPLDQDAATLWWANQAKLRRAGLEILKKPAGEIDELPTAVIVRADRAVSYGSVRRTLATAQDQGFAHFSLFVLRRTGP
jgi:biopolymer transport protein ExbD